MKKWINALILVLALGLGASVATAASTPKPETRIYIAKDEPSKRVLENMLEMLGLRLVTSPIPNRPVSGKFEFATLDDIMAYFKGSFRINWFQNGTQVHVYLSNDWKTQKIYVGGTRTNDDWKDLLTSSGLYYKEFPFAINPDTQELIISGPRSYLKLVADNFEQPPPDPSEIAKHGIELMVFPLRHASVEDRQTTLRGTTLTTPGVLSVMLNLLGLPNQRMTASPENKKAGLISDASGLQTPMTREMQEPIIRSSPSGSSIPGTPEKKDKKPKEELPMSVTADPRTNSILIRDAKSKYEYYRELIEKLDKPVQMIEVEAMLVEVTQTGMNQLGLEFGYKSGHLQYEFSDAASLGGNSLIPAGSASIVDPGRFIARLKALSADKNAKVLARPTIVTQDNASAYIDLSQTLYLQLTGERIANAMPVTAGSLLQVTPRVVREGDEEKIFVKIEIQDGSLNRNLLINGFPAVENTSLSTQALIQREKAILVGGYNRETAEDKEYRVPFLSNIPYIGKAFTSTDKSNENRLRLFLITPRLIDEPAHNAVSTREAIMAQQKHFGLGGYNLEATPSLKLDRTLER